MDKRTSSAARAELESIIRDAWAIAGRSGDPRDKEIAAAVESDARELLALLPEQRAKRAKSNRAMKRKAFKHCIRLDAGAPILSQVRHLVR